MFSNLIYFLAASSFSISDGVIRDVTMDVGIAHLPWASWTKHVAFPGIPLDVIRKMLSWYVLFWFFGQTFLLPSWTNSNTYGMMILIELDRMISSMGPFIMMTCIDFFVQMDWATRKSASLCKLPLPRKRWVHLSSTFNFHEFWGPYWSTNIVFEKKN